MRIGEIRALTGPNVYNHLPVLSMRLYLDVLARKENREFPGFNELLPGRLLGLAKYHCCAGRENRFVERLRAAEVQLLKGIVSSEVARS
jgi:cyanophycin synthetase